MFDLEPGGPHLDTQRFGFVAAGDGAAVIVGQHHDGTVVKVRSEYAFAGHVEIIAIDQGVHVGQALNCLMAATTTPHT